MTDEEPKAGLVQKGGAYPVTEATGEEGGFTRTYRVQANPPDQWWLQKDTVVQQFVLDAEAEGEKVNADDVEVGDVVPDEPNGVVNVTLQAAAPSKEEKKAATKK